MRSPSPQTEDASMSRMSCLMVRPTFQKSLRSSTPRPTVTQTVVVEPASSVRTVNGIAMSPNGRYAYVSNLGSNSVSVLDTANNTIVKTVLVGTSPGGVAVTPDGAYVYVSNQGSNSVSVINAASDTVVATIPVAGTWRDIDHSADARTMRKFPLTPVLSNYRDFAPTELSSAR